MATSVEFLCRCHLNTFVDMLMKQSPQKSEAYWDAMKLANLMTQQYLTQIIYPISPPPFCSGLVKELETTAPCPPGKVTGTQVQWNLAPFSMSLAQEGVQASNEYTAWIGCTVQEASAYSQGYDPLQSLQALDPLHGWPGVPCRCATTRVG